jgi:hypothetical protein
MSVVIWSSRPAWASFGRRLAAAWSPAVLATIEAIDCDCHST